MHSSAMVHSHGKDNEKGVHEATEKMYQALTHGVSMVTVHASKDGAKWKKGNINPPSGSTWRCVYPIQYN